MSEHSGRNESAPAGAKSQASTRLNRRLTVLRGRRREPEPISVLRLLNTEEVRLALGLIERAGVLPNGEVRNPDAFREATREELGALEHWKQLCGEPLDHLELAEELLDRVGEAHGWRSPETLDTALLLKRLELPNESPWFVQKMAEAVVSLYAEMEEHGVGRGGGSLHPHVRGAVRRLERLEEMDRPAPGPEEASGSQARTEAVDAQQGSEEQEVPQRRSNAEGYQSTTEDPPAEESPRRRRSWWRDYFGFD